MQPKTQEKVWKVSPLAESLPETSSVDALKEVKTKAPSAPRNDSKHKDKKSQTAAEAEIVPVPWGWRHRRIDMKVCEREMKRGKGISSLEYSLDFPLYVKGEVLLPFQTRPSVSKEELDAIRTNFRDVLATLVNETEDFPARAKVEPLLKDLAQYNRAFASDLHSCFIEYQQKAKEKSKQLLTALQQQLREEQVKEQIAEKEGESLDGTREEDEAESEDDVEDDDSMGEQEDSDEDTEM